MHTHLEVCDVDLQLLELVLQPPELVHHLLVLESHLFVRKAQHAVSQSKSSEAHMLRC
jgi:hypothetical protein